MTVKAGRAIVHNMNNKGPDTDEYRSLLLLDEISRSDELTQRDLSKKLGFALGLINSYLKNLVSKGYITVSTIPKKRYRYYLTPRGFAEKTRLTYQHLQNFTNLYRVARKDFHALFKSLERSESRKVVFCGVDEVAEIAYLSLAETSLDLVGVIDGKPGDKKFFGYPVRAMDEITEMDYDLIIITSFHGGGEFAERLVGLGVEKKRICDISAEGWLKRITG